MSMNPMELKGALEAIIYAADEPATLDQIANAVGEEKETVRATLDEMIAAYAAEDRGVEVRAVAGGYKFYTKPQHHEVVRRFIKSLRPPLRLTMAALETLAVIAYRQPVTGPEIQEIRGVNVSGVIKTLLEKRLIVTAGRKAVMGKPVLYRSSKEFLMRFGLSDLEELPSLKEFEQLARAALGSDEGIAPVEAEAPAAEEAPNGAEAAAVEAAETNLPAEFSETEESDASAETAETNTSTEASEAGAIDGAVEPSAVEATETLRATELSEPEATDAPVDAPAVEAAETNTATEASEEEIDRAVAAEAVQQEPRETPEAAQPDAEHSLESKAESAS